MKKQENRTRNHETKEKRDDVAKARMEEMTWYEKLQAFEKVTDETCVLRRGRKPISCPWRDINKGDSGRVEVRSRLVAREITQKGTDSHLKNTTIGTRALRDKQSCLTPNELSCTPTH